MISVMLVDDQNLVRKGVRSLLELADEIEVVAEVKDGESAVVEVSRLKPDLVIMDVIMPGMGGLEAVAEIMATQPTPILMLSANTDPGDSNSAFAAIRLGALDVMEKPGGVVVSSRERIVLVAQASS